MLPETLKHQPKITLWAVKVQLQVITSPQMTEDLLTKR